ncbi:MAG: hypothetical protein HY271_10315 [Deltaproteobacteria bacterium]|nr:hypothetical protein [Deltaproteobacteria bacterium]
MRGRCERLLVMGCVLGLLAVPAIAESKKQHGGSAPDQGTGGGAPPDQMDFFQGLSLGSNKEPIHINSDSLELDYKGSVLTYSGNVKVTQADVTLTSDHLAITYDRQAVQRSPAPDSASSPGAAPSPAVARSPGAAPAPAASPAQLGGGADKIKEVVAEGHVRIQRGDRVAEGRRAVFDQVKQTIVLSDGAVLHEGANRVAGDRIIVYLQEQRSVVESGSNSRVSAVFYPNANPSSGPLSRPTPSGAAAVRSPDVRLGAASGAPTDAGR